MTFETFFKLTSFAVVLCGLLSLMVSGGVGPIFAFVFVVLTIVAWRLERTDRWQLSDRSGTALVVAAIPLFYIIWKFRLFGVGESAVAGLLSRFILGLSLIKLFQRKRDRDWLFLYLMAFFEILLSAALSISPLYFAVFVLYLIVTSVAVIAFEIGKSARLVSTDETRSGTRLDDAPLRRLPSTSVLLIVAVIVFAAPIFFLLPRVGGAGFGANQTGITGMTGFSDRVRLGEIGRIQQSNETVMRVKVDSSERPPGGLRWRGIALDQFDNKTWRQSRIRRQSFVRNEREIFFVGNRFSRPKLVFQTFYLEPMDTSVIFGLPRPIVVQGGFLELRKDDDDGLTAARPGFERFNYTVQSDIGQPSAEQLRADSNAYDAEEVRRFLQLPPNLDPRIAELSAEVMRGHETRFDRAKAVEEFLQTRFGYTLEQKASGDQPVADFLFNIREGHCEYFSSAMVMMLRTQGIAARVVNGFQSGDYNETAGVYVVKQRDAHSWVEVYFPKDRTWVTFDPTPFAGLGSGDDGFGMLGALQKYIEALETFWIQYFVAFDNQEQRSLFRSVKEGFSDFQNSASAGAEDLQIRLQQWFSDLRGEQGFEARLSAAAWGAAYLVGIVLGVFVIRYAYRFALDRSLLERLGRWFRRRKDRGIVEFYDRMQRILSRRGFLREDWQTPLEFAAATGISEATAITERYNRVRFGGKALTRVEAEEIEEMLRRIADPDREP